MPRQLQTVVRPPDDGTTKTNNPHTKETHQLSKPRIGHNPNPVMPNENCPYPGCGQQRLEVDGQMLRHCEGHNIQITAA